MLAGRPWRELVASYGRSHGHPLNQRLHLVGIPLIVLSLPLALAALLVPALLRPALALFVLGWLLQFVGHGIEGKPPEFLQDPRYLLVGVRWWWSKVRPAASPPRTRD